MGAVDLVLTILLIALWVLLIISIINDFISTKKWDKNLQQQHDKIMKDLDTTKTLVEITADNTKLVKAIDEAGLNIYKTPTGNYILVPKEDK